MTMKASIDRVQTGCFATWLLLVVGILISGCATLDDSRTVTLGAKSVMILSERTGSAEANAKGIGVMLAVATMEAQCARQGIRVLSRREYENKVRDILKEQGASSITLRYMDDGATKTISVASSETQTAVSPASSVAPVQSSETNAMTIWDAARDGSTNQVVRFLKQGIAVDSRNGSDLTPLMIAARAGHLDVVKLLVANGADVNAADKDDRSPLKCAINARPVSKNRSFHQDKLGGLKDVTITFTSTGGEYLELIRFLIDKGANVNAAGAKGQTPILEKLGTYWNNMDNKRLDTLKILVEKGANVNASSSYGNTPLLAVLNSHGVYDDTLVLVDYLIKKGADVNACDNRGETPLMRASDLSWHGSNSRDSKRTLEVVKLLVENGANVNTADKSGRTALMRADRLGVLAPIADYLRAHGASK